MSAAGDGLRAVRLSHSTRAIQADSIQTYEKPVYDNEP